MTRSQCLLGAACCAVVWPILAAAEDSPAPDTSQYTVFDPVPDDQMRPFATDRPTKSDTPFTVDAGHFQYEADIVNWSYDRNSARDTTTSNLVFDPTLKLGLTHNTDIELAFAPINLDHERDGDAGTRFNRFGFGDIDARVKVNLVGDDGGDLAIAIVPYVKVPTASPGIGNGYWEGGAYVPIIVSLPDNWTLDVTSEIDRLENANLTGTHNNYQNLINLNHAVFVDSLTGYVEFWSQVTDDRAAPAEFSLDFALAWAVGPNFQLDSGVNIGLNRATDNAQVYLGISQRF